MESFRQNPFRSIVSWNATQDWFANLLAHGPLPEVPEPPHGVDRDRLRLGVPPLRQAEEVVLADAGRVPRGSARDVPAPRVGVAVLRGRPRGAPRPPRRRPRAHGLRLPARRGARRADQPTSRTSRTSATHPTSRGSSCATTASRSPSAARPDPTPPTASQPREMKLGLNLVMVRPDLMPAVAARAEARATSRCSCPTTSCSPRGGQPVPVHARRHSPFPLDTPLFDPIVLLTRLAQATWTIKLGTAVVPAPAAPPAGGGPCRHHPRRGVRWAGGARRRRGWFADEFTALGLDPRTRFSRTEEAVAVCASCGPSATGDVPRSPLRLRRGLLRAEAGQLAASADPARRRIGAGAGAGGAGRRRLDLGGTVETVERHLRTLADRAPRGRRARPFDVTVLHPQPVGRQTSTASRARRRPRRRAAVAPRTRAR